MKLSLKDYTNNINFNIQNNINDECLPIKIGQDKESFINILCYKIVELITPMFYSLGFTPNMITTLSLIPAYYCYIYLVKKDIKCIFYYFLYMILDYTDGYMARKYKLYSKFGDLYDHGRDMIFHLFLLSVFYKDTKLLIIFIILNVLGLGLFGCQEILFEDKCKESNNSTVYWLKPFCNKNMFFDIYNYFIGTSSMYLGTAICLYLFCTK
jgi:hypothetical protein